MYVFTCVYQSTHIHVCLCMYVYILYLILDEFGLFFSSLPVLEVQCCCCSVIKSCLTVCYPVYCSTPGFPVLQYLPEVAQTHVH